MSDETKQPPPEDVITPAASAAVHGDQMWETPAGEKGRWIENLGHEPEFFESKSAYLRRLNETGQRMKDQQESSTGPEREIIAPTPLSELPTTPPAPITQGEAHIFAAMKAFWLKHGIREALYCLRCFTRKRPHGTIAQTTSKGVWVRCRCGQAEYVAPQGTTDLVLDRYTNLTHTATDKTEGIISQGFGGKQVPTVLLHDREALMIHLYFAILKRRQYEPLWFCNSCWNGRPTDDQSMGILVEANKVAIVCAAGCRMLAWQNRDAANAVDIAAAGALAAMKTPSASTH